MTVAATLVQLAKVMEAAEDEEVLVALAVVDVEVVVEEVDEAEVTVVVEAGTMAAIMKDQEVEVEVGGVEVLQELEGPRALQHQPLVDERQPVVAHREQLALLQIWMKKVENISPFYNCLSFAQHNVSPFTQSSSRPHRHLQNRGRLPLNRLPPNLHQRPLRMRVLELGQAGTRTQTIRTRSVATVARSLSSVRSRKRASTKAALSENVRPRSAAFSHGETNPQLRRRLQHRQLQEEQIPCLRLFWGRERSLNVQ